MRKSRSVLIFLHGSGGTGHDIREFVDNAPLKEFGNNSFSDVCKDFSMDIITPTSDVRRFTAMGGERMNIWFDRTSKFFSKDGLDDLEDLDGVEMSMEKILRVIAEVELNYDHIFLGGHSMGGVMALHALRKNVSPKFRGIFCIGSCLLNMSAVFVGPPLGTASKSPVLMMHGTRDDMVSCQWAQKTAATLELKDVNVQFRTYGHAYHDLEEDQLVDLVHWIKDAIHTAQTKVNSDVKSCVDSERSNDSDSKSSSGRNSSPSSSFHPGENKVGPADSKGDDSIEAVEKLMQRQTLGSSDKSSNDQQILSGGGGESGERPCAIPFTIERTDEASASRYATPKFIIRYAVPIQYVATMTARPVLACGSMFEIFADSPNGVRTTISSSDPSKTAVEIGRRLQIRATSGSGSLNPCNMS